jgi:hypothetical protein
MNGFSDPISAALGLSGMFGSPKPRCAEQVRNISDRHNALLKQIFTQMQPQTLSGLANQWDAQQGGYQQDQSRFMNQAGAMAAAMYQPGSSYNDPNFGPEPKEPEFSELSFDEQLKKFDSPPTIAEIAAAEAELNG